jgi:hypothetical protein
LRRFGLHGELEPNRLALGAALFVLSAVLLLSGVPVLLGVGGAIWFLAVFLAIRGWLRVMRSRRSR